MSTSPICRHSENWSCKDIIKGYIIKVSQVYDRVYKSDYIRSTLAKKYHPRVIYQQTQLKKWEKEVGCNQNNTQKLCT
jgi:hypothetical protein